MPIQSLGIFESVLDWVMDKIIDPIVSWLGKILESMFSWILQEIIIPFIKPVFNLVWNILVVNIRDLFYTPIYLAYTRFLRLLDQLQSGFDVLIGLKDISYIDASGEKQYTTLLNYLIYNDTIRNVLVGITFIAFALAMIFSIYSVIRSTLDFDFEGKRPVGKVLSATAKTMLSFLIVPLIVWFGLNLSSILLKQTSTAIMGGEDATLGRWILAISSMKAVGPYTIEEMMAGTEVTTPIYNDDGTLHAPFDVLINGEVGYEAFIVKIHPSKVDYLLGYSSAIFAAIMMIICFFTFIRRIFDIIILYITSPYFSATMVLDDGEKFKRWRETFIAKTVMGFGSAIGMRIYLMIVPVVMSPNIRFFSTMAGEWAGGYIVRIVFLLGGMYAVHKSSSLLTSIISSSVGAQENADNAIMAGMVASGAQRVTMKAGGILLGAAKGGGSRTNTKTKTGDNKFKGESGKTGKFQGGSGKTGKFRGAQATASKIKSDSGKTPKIDSGKFDDKFKDDLKETFGLSGDQFIEDYNGEDYLKKNPKYFMPLQDVGGMPGYDIYSEYTNDAEDIMGNADVKGIRSVTGEDPLDLIKNGPDMSSARKFNGEQKVKGDSAKSAKAIAEKAKADSKAKAEAKTEGSTAKSVQEIAEKAKADSKAMAETKNEGGAAKSAAKIVEQAQSEAKATAAVIENGASNGSEKSGADTAAQIKAEAKAKAEADIVDPVRKAQEKLKEKRQDDSNKF